MNFLIENINFHSKYFVLGYLKLIPILSPDNVKVLGLVIVEQLLGLLEVLLDLLDAPQQRHVSVVALPLEQSLALEVDQTVFPSSRQNAHNFVRYGLIDVENVFEQHQSVAVA